MEKSLLLDKILDSNKPLSALFNILLQPNLKFYQEHVLKKIMSVLEGDISLTEAEQSAFTETILNVEEHVVLCYQILKLIWKESNTGRHSAASTSSSVSETTEASGSSVIQEEQQIVNNEAGITIKEEKDEENSMDVEDNLEYAPVDSSHLIEVIIKGDGNEPNPLPMKFRLYKPPDAASGIEWLKEALQKLMRTILMENLLKYRSVLVFEFPKKFSIPPVAIEERTPFIEPSSKILYSHFEEACKTNDSLRNIKVLDLSATLKADDENFLLNIWGFKKYKNYTTLDPEEKDCNLAIALLLGKTLHMPDIELRRRLITSWMRSTTKVKEEAMKLMMSCGYLTHLSDLSAMDDLKLIDLFAAAYPNYLVVIYDKKKDFSPMFKSLDYRKNSEHPRKVITILFDKTTNHYFCVTTEKPF